jgi:CRP-like cAMP-binding protein
MLKHPNFIPLALLQSSRRFELLAGQHLFARGAPVEYLHWVLRGELYAVRTTPSGQEAVMMRGHAGEFFAEAALFAPLYTCDAIARKPAVLIGIPVANLRQTLLTDSAFSNAFLSTVVMGLRRQCSRVERLRLRGASERIEHFLSCEVGPDGWSDLGRPLSEWALDLGLEPETLYRTLRALELKGTLQRKGRRMRLVDSNPPLNIDSSLKS